MGNPIHREEEDYGNSSAQKAIGIIVDISIKSLNSTYINIINRELE
jgi:hypothetical protein